MNNQDNQQVVSHIRYGTTGEGSRLVLAHTNVNVGNNIDVSVSICRNGDTFTKERGRNIAIARLSKVNKRVNYPVDLNQVQETVNNILNDLSGMTNQEVADHFNIVNKHKRR